MNYKLFGSTILVTSLLLSACGNNNETKKDEKLSTEAKKTEKKVVKKEKIKNKADKTKEKIQNPNESSNQNKNINEPLSTEVASNELNQQTSVENNVQSINVNNILSRSDLEKVIYGNYSEIDKITAYNNAVSNGIIPQGNVMEGSASKAYESSLRVESGQEKSAYISNPYPDNPATEKYNHLYNSTNATDDIDPNYTPYNSDLESEIAPSN